MPNTQTKSVSFSLKLFTVVVMVCHELHAKIKTKTLQSDICSDLKESENWYENGSFVKI